MSLTPPPSGPSASLPGGGPGGPGGGPGGQSTTSPGGSSTSVGTVGTPGPPGGSSTSTPGSNSISSPPISSTPTSAAQSSSTTTSTSTSIVIAAPPPPTVTQTKISTVNPHPTETPSGTSAQNNLGHATGFFANKGAVAGVFTVVGLIALALFIAIATNVIRRRRAKKFDDEVAAAAAAAYTDADRGGPGWVDEDWQDAPTNTSRAYTTSSGGHTAGTFGAYGGGPMPVPLQGGAYHDNPHGNEYNMEEFPQRNQMYADNGNPFGDPGYRAGGVAPGIAGVGAAGAAGQEMRYRGNSVSPVGGQSEQYDTMGPVLGDGMGFDSGRYPVPGRSRSFNQGHAGSKSLGGRSPSMSSSGHSHSVGMVTSSRTPPPGRYISPPPMPAQQQRLPQTPEIEDEDPYDGVTPESEGSDPHQYHPDDEDPELAGAPRVLRVANA